MGDFGLSGKSGGTSMFMAPEGLNKDFRMIGKTDLYSFAVTVLFLMFSEDLALQLLYLPIDTNLEIFLQSLNRCPLLEMIFKSLRSDPEKRVTLQSWSTVLDKMKDFDEKLMIEKITIASLEKESVVLDPLNKALINEAGFVMDSSEVNKNKWIMSKAISHVQKLSSIYCDQKFSLLSKGLILIKINNQFTEKMDTNVVKKIQTYMTRGSKIFVGPTQFRLCFALQSNQQSKNSTSKMVLKFLKTRITIK